MRANFVMDALRRSTHTPPSPPNGIFTVGKMVMHLICIFYALCLSQGNQHALCVLQQKRDYGVHIRPMFGVVACEVIRIFLFCYLGAAG